MLRYGYCERLGDGFWDEPFNALTNAAFSLAAVAAFGLWRRVAKGDRPSLLLTALVFAIGIGSFLFHMMPRGWTLVADVAPIQLFAFCYVGLALSRFLCLGRAVAALGAAGFLLFAFALSAGLAPLLPVSARGSAGYAAFLLGLFAVAGAILRYRPQARATGRLLAGAGLVFGASLTLRTLDGPLCGWIALGTHWLWHLLNAVVLYLLLRAAITHGSTERGSAARR